MSDELWRPTQADLPEHVIMRPYTQLHRHEVADALWAVLRELDIDVDDPDVWPVLGADRQWDGLEVLYLGGIPLKTAEQLVAAVRRLMEEAETLSPHQSNQRQRGHHAKR